MFCPGGCKAYTNDAIIFSESIREFLKRMSGARPNSVIRAFDKLAWQGQVCWVGEWQKS